LTTRTAVPWLQRTVLLLHAAGRPAEATALAEREFQRTLPPEQEAEVRLNLSMMFSRSPGERTEDNRRALALDGVPVGLRAQHLARLTHNLATSGHYREARGVAAFGRGCDCSLRRANCGSGDAYSAVGARICRRAL